MDNFTILAGAKHSRGTRLFMRGLLYACDNYTKHRDKLMLIFSPQVIEIFDSLHQLCPLIKQAYDTIP